MECPECGGKGGIRWDDSAVSQPDSCPLCAGAGTIDPEEAIRGMYKAFHRLAEDMVRTSKDLKRIAMWMERVKR
jgi:hypothetical protein